MVTHSSILAWRIPWTEEPGGLQSMGLQRCRHNWMTEHIHVGYQGLGKVEAYCCNPSFPVKKEGAQAQNERKKKKKNTWKPELLDFALFWMLSYLLYI